MIQDMLATCGSRIPRSPIELYKHTTAFTIISVLVDNFRFDCERGAARELSRRLRRAACMGGESACVKQERQAVPHVRKRRTGQVHDVRFVLFRLRVTFICVPFKTSGTWSAKIIG
jgi:hypothetical protein